MCEFPPEAPLSHPVRGERDEAKRFVNSRGSRCRREGQSLLGGARPGLPQHLRALPQFPEPLCALWVTPQKGWAAPDALSRPAAQRCHSAHRHGGSCEGHPGTLRTQQYHHHPDCLQSWAPLYAAGGHGEAGPPIRQKEAPW